MPNNNLSESKSQDLLTVLLSRLVSSSGETQRRLSLRTGLTKDQISRTLCGARRVELDEVLAILRALDLPARATVALALFGRTDLAVDWSKTGAAGFLEALIEALPGSFAEELGEGVQRINPKWGSHAARVVAKRIAQHLGDIDNCEDRLASDAAPSRTPAGA